MTEHTYGEIAQKQDAADLATISQKLHFPADAGRVDRHGKFYVNAQWLVAQLVYLEAAGLLNPER